MGSKCYLWSSDKATPVTDTCSAQITLPFLTCPYTLGGSGWRKDSPTVRDTWIELASCTMARDYCQEKTTDAFQDQMSNKSSGYLLRQSDPWHDETAERLLRRKPELFLLNAMRSLGMMIMWLWHSSDWESRLGPCAVKLLGSGNVWHDSWSKAPANIQQDFFLFPESTPHIWLNIK